MVIFMVQVPLLTLIKQLIIIRVIIIMVREEANQKYHLVENLVSILTKALTNQVFLVFLLDS